MNQNDALLEYRRAAVRSAGPAELAVLLYDMLLQRLRAVQQSMNNIEARTQAVKDALAILEVLQGTLNLESGEAARNMDRLYRSLRALLLEAHAKNSAGLVETQISILLPLRAAWAQAGNSAKDAAPNAASAAAFSAPPNVSLNLETRERSQWEA